MDRSDWLLGGLLGWIHFTFHVLMRLIPALIPILAVALDYPLWKLGVLVSVSLLGSSVGLLPMGVAADRYDRRAILSSALAVVGLGFLIFALAPSPGAGLLSVSLVNQTLEGPYLVMSLAMLIMGLGISAHVPVGIPLLTKNTDDANIGRVLGVWGAGSKFGDAAAPALVGLMILFVGWAPILALFGIAGILSATVLYVVLGVARVDTEPGVAPCTDTVDNAAKPALLTDRRSYLYPILALFGLLRRLQRRCPGDNSLHAGVHRRRLRVYPPFGRDSLRP